MPLDGVPVISVGYPEPRGVSGRPSVTYALKVGVGVAGIDLSTRCGSVDLILPVRRAAVEFGTLVESGGGDEVAG